VRSVAEHREAVLNLVAPLPSERVALVDAEGAALANNVVAGIALPSFDNSAMDGYAVRAAEVASVPVQLPVVMDIPAGSGLPEPLKAGAVARIMTGAPVPEGADSVVPVEWTDAGEAVVRINDAAQLGANIRRRGEDVAPGDMVLSAGDELTPSRIGLLAALGMHEVDVGRRPRVGVVSTGSELVEPGHPLPDGAIFDSNSPLLTALVRRAGAIAVPHPPLPDDPDSAAAALERLVADVDVLVTSGGISAGAYEVVKDVFAVAGGVEFVRVAMQSVSSCRSRYSCGRPCDGSAVIESSTVRVGAACWHHRSSVGQRGSNTCAARGAQKAWCDRSGGPAHICSVHLLGPMCCSSCLPARTNLPLARKST
jgi:molybdopterin molybdotransferase